MLVSYALVTLDNTKTFLGIADHTKDALLEMLINMATDYVESQTGRRFVSTVHTQEEFDGTGTHQLNLKAFPIITFSLLEVNSAADNSDDWSTVNASEYCVDLETGIISKTSTFTDNDEANDDEDSLSD